MSEQQATTRRPGSRQLRRTGALVLTTAALGAISSPEVQAESSDANTKQLNERVHQQAYQLAARVIGLTRDRQGGDGSIDDTRHNSFFAGGPHTRNFTLIMHAKPSHVGHEGDEADDVRERNIYQFDALVNVGRDGITHPENIVQVDMAEYSHRTGNELFRAGYSSIGPYEYPHLPAITPDWKVFARYSLAGSDDATDRAAQTAKPNAMYDTPRATISQLNALNTQFNDVLTLARNGQPIEVLVPPTPALPAAEVYNFTS